MQEKSILTITKYKIVICTIQYIILMGIITTGHYILENELHIYGAYITSWLKYIVNVLFEFVEIPLTISYIYMLHKGKYKIKRFFSFFSIHFFSFVLQMITISLFWKGCDVLYAIAQRNFSNWIYLCEVITYLFSIIRFIFLSFKAYFPYDNFKCVFKKIIAFIKFNYKKVIVFNLKFIPWVVVYKVLRYILFYKFYFDEYIYILLDVCFYGIGIFLFPYYILSFKFLIDKNKSCIN